MSIVYQINNKLSVKKMNSKTMHKLSLQLLNDNDQNKENQTYNISTEHTLRIHNENKQHYTKQQIINVKRMNAKKIQQLNIQKDKQIINIKEKYQKQMKDVVQKYQKIIVEKDQYIKMLEQMCTGKQQENKKQIQKPKIEQKKQIIKITKNENNKQQFSQTLYLHQAPLYGQLCYSIQRPIINRNPQVSQFLSTQKLKSRVTSNEKKNHLQCQNSVSSSKYRSTSTARPNSASRHGLAPACPPKYSINQ